MTSDRPAPRTVVFTGAREWTDERTVLEALTELPYGSRIIFGDNKHGLDEIVKRLAETRFSSRLIIDPPYVADWQKHGLGAGPRRNLAMLDEMPDEVWAFHDDLEASKGTRNCVTEAVKRKIPVRQFISRAAAGAMRRS